MDVGTGIGGASADRQLQACTHRQRRVAGRSSCGSVSAIAELDESTVAVECGGDFSRRCRDADVSGIVALCTGTAIADLNGGIRACSFERHTVLRRNHNGSGGIGRHAVLDISDLDCRAVFRGIEVDRTAARRDGNVPARSAAEIADQHRAGAEFAGVSGHRQIDVPGCGHIDGAVRSCAVADARLSAIGRCERERAARLNGQIAGACPRPAFAIADCGEIGVRCGHPDIARGDDVVSADNVARAAIGDACFARLAVGFVGDDFDRRGVDVDIAARRAGGTEAYSITDSGIRAVAAGVNADIAGRHADIARRAARRRGDRAIANERIRTRAHRIDVERICADRDAAAFG